MTEIRRGLVKAGPAMGYETPAARIERLIVARDAAIERAEKAEAERDALRAVVVLFDQWHDTDDDLSSWSALMTARNQLTAPPNVDNRIVDGIDLAVREVPYRDDLVDIDHPDARFIAAAPQIVADLLDHIDALTAEREALRAKGDAMADYIAAETLWGDRPHLLRADHPLRLWRDNSPPPVDGGESRDR